MKFLNPICLFICILSLCFSACFTPNSPAASLAASPADSPAGDTDTTVFNDTELFTVTIAIAGDGQSRSVAGLPRDKLKAGSGVRNFAQLIVLDTKSKKLMGFAEIHQSGDITINALPLGKTYAFLLLMGHWKGEEGQDGQWVPAPDDPFPTLLNAGLTEYILNAGDSAKIGIVMYPLVVNTVFTEQVESGSGQTVHPLVEEGKPKPAYLFPGNWTVNWAIQRTNPGTDGLERLIAAQAIMESTGYDLEPDHYTGGELKIQKLRYITPDGPWEPEPGITSTTKDISYDISAYTQAIGSGGAVNFNVEYVPFNLTAAADWQIAYNAKPVNTACADGIPKWIIRNGVND
ncbi:MAG: hypothetical protein LBD65_05870, partial [Spirochaetaceae bacterium]|nr:hypothetical protein [Spirochaetaceae bacterium]